MSRILRSAARLTAASSVALPLTVLAQPAVRPAADSARRDSIARARAALAPVVVTATRLDVPTVAATASVTVLTGDDLRARGVASASDALREVPGVAVLQSGSFGGATSLFVRGGQNSYTKVLVDGAPANLPGGSLDLAYLTLDNVERIEVVRGPASVLYGSDAVTGVVQIFTRRGAQAPVRVRAAARGGSLGAQEGELGVAGTAGTVSYSVSGARHATDGVLPVNNGFRNAVASGALRWAPTARTSAAVAARYSDGVFHYPTTGTGWIPAQADSNAFTASRRLTLSLDAGHFVASRLEGRVLLSESRVDDRGEDAADNAADQGFHSRFTSATTRRAADARVNLYAAPGQVLTAGVELSRQGLATGGWSQMGTGPRTTDAPFDTTRRTTAYYGQWVGELGGRATVTAGARLDDNQYFGTFGTWRVGAGLRLGRGLTVRGAAGTAFKEPTFGEQFTTAWTNGNRDLDPERSRSWELGLEQQALGGRALVRATYFDQRFRDMVVYAFSADRARPDYANVAGAIARGVEAELRGRAAATLGAGLAYTYVHTEVTEAGRAPSLAFARGLPLLRRPRTTVAGDLRWRPLDALTSSVVVTYVGARPDVAFAPDFTASRVRLGGYARTDLSADVRLLRAAGPRPDAALTLRVDNVLDRRVEALAGFPSPGRVALVGVRLGAS